MMFWTQLLMWEEEKEAKCPNGAQYPLSSICPRRPGALLQAGALSGLWTGVGSNLHPSPALGAPAAASAAEMDHSASSGWQREGLEEEGKWTWYVEITSALWKP